MDDEAFKRASEIVNTWSEYAKLGDYVRQWIERNERHYGLHDKRSLEEADPLPVRFNRVTEHIHEQHNKAIDEANRLLKDKVVEAYTTAGPSDAWIHHEPPTDEELLTYMQQEVTRLERSDTPTYPARMILRRFEELTSATPGDVVDRALHDLSKAFGPEWEVFIQVKPADHPTISLTRQAHEQAMRDGYKTTDLETGEVSWAGGDKTEEESDLNAASRWRTAKLKGYMEREGKTLNEASILTGIPRGLLAAIYDGYQSELGEIAAMQIARVVGGTTKEWLLGKDIGTERPGRKGLDQG